MIDNDCFKVLKMVYTPPKWILLSLHLFVILYQQTIAARDVNYNELIQLKASCRNLDSCQRYRTSDDLRVVNCQCGPVCAQLGTCCVDSKYRTRRRQINSRIVATKVYRNPAVVFMVNDCKPGWVGDKGIKDLCEVSIGHAYSKDPFLLMPVTNLRSGMTYKNYYCFSCNEDRSLDSPVLWDLRLYRDESVNLFLGNISDVRFDEGQSDYTVNDSKDVPYYSNVGIPEKLHRYLNWYRQDVISTCDEKWTDVSIKEKCSAYTALVYYYQKYRSPIYKNPHCAICNYKSVSDLRCTEPVGNEVWGGPPYGFLLSGIFSFEDKVSRCPRNEVFDKFSKKCRAFRCGRNQKIVEGKCDRNK